MRVVKLSGAVRDYVLNSISSETGVLDPAAARQFFDRLPDVLRRCDEDIYDAPFAAEAYAFVHLVDRYRRFWSVLEELLRARELPVRDTTLDVLDVGTGPAPALYAVNDFFEELRDFAGRATDCERLHTPPPRLRSIEASRGMVRLVHNLSEFTGRPGPFQPDATKFEGFNPPQARAAERLRLMEKLMNQWDYSEQEARIQAHLDQADWQGVARYHICIFSNFLTSPTQVPHLASELNQVFRALRPRGIVIIVGGTGGKYPLIYEKLDAIARESHVQRATYVPPSLPCDYNSAEADEIKQLYRSVFESLRRVIPLDDLRKLPRDLWDPGVPLRGPRAFGVRVYRAPNRPPGARFTKHQMPKTG
jgi:SAM-dependent methyltransferase